ncbi:hypothetical protein D018_4913B, partial [Vibrio parahaemolyticus VP2007-007]
QKRIDESDKRPTRLAHNKPDT